MAQAEVRLPRAEGFAYLELGLLDVRRVHRADVEPRDAQQQQPQPLLLRRGPRRRYQLRLRAVRRVGRIKQRLVRRRRGGGEARLRAARALRVHRDELLFGRRYCSAAA